MLKRNYLSPFPDICPRGFLGLSLSSLHFDPKYLWNSCIIYGQLAVFNHQIFAIAWLMCMHASVCMYILYTITLQLYMEMYSQSHCVDIEKGLMKKLWVY